MTGTVGPIIFSDSTARQQLLSEGVVVTFRAGQRTAGETWWRASRTGPKEGDVTIEKIGPADPRRPQTLAPYQENSGFRSVRAWREAILKLNGNPGQGYLYRVTKRGRP